MPRWRYLGDGELRIGTDPVRKGDIIRAPWAPNKCFEWVEGDLPPIIHQPKPAILQ